MSTVEFLKNSTSYGQVLLLLSVIKYHILGVVCAPKSSREEYKLYKQPLQKIISIESVSGLKIASSSVSWMLQGWQKYWDCETTDGGSGEGLWELAPFPRAYRSPFEETKQGGSEVTRRDVLVVFNSVPGTGTVRTVRAKPSGSKVQKSLSNPRWDLWPQKMSEWCCTHAKEPFWEVPSLALALHCSRHTRGHFPSFPGALELTKMMFHVAACPAEACGGMIMAVRLFKV